MIFKYNFYSQNIRICSLAWKCSLILTALKLKD